MKRVSYGAIALTLSRRHTHVHPTYSPVIVFSSHGLFFSLSHFLSSVYNRVYKYLFVVWVFLFHSICSSTTLGRACTCTFNILLFYASPPLHTIRCPFFLYPPPFPHSLIRIHFAHRYIVIVTPTFFAL
jgi:hypothetical protein